MTFVRSDVLGKPICEALGLNSANVKSIMLDLTAGELAGVIVEMYVKDEHTDAIKAVFRAYRIVDADQ